MTINAARNLQQVAEAERAQQEAAEDQMASPPDGAEATTTELQALPPSLDPRGYYLQTAQASMLAAASTASSSSSQHQQEHHLQTALHLGYHIKVDTAAASKGFL